MPAPSCHTAHLSLLLFSAGEPCPTAWLWTKGSNSALWKLQCQYWQKKKTNLKPTIQKNEASKTLPHLLGTWSWWSSMDIPKDPWSFCLLTGQMQKSYHTLWKEQQMAYLWTHELSFPPMKKGSEAHECIQWTFIFRHWLPNSESSWVSLHT